AGSPRGVGDPLRDEPAARTLAGMTRQLRVALTLVVTGLCAAYIVWQIDVGRAARELGRADYGYFAASVAIMAGSVAPMAWRWQRLLAARGIREPLGWLTRTYFVAYAVGQVLPTSLGGDASRIFETSLRYPGRGGAVAGSVLLERALGGAANLVLAAVGFALAIGRYDVGGYIWIELAFVDLAALGGVVLFSRTLRRPLRRFVPLLQTLRLERPLRAVYEGIHGYREHAALLGWMFALTLAVQAVRVLAISLAGKAVGG